MKTSGEINKAMLLAGGIFILCMNMANAEEGEQVNSEQVLDYTVLLAEDGETYEVWMKPLLTPKPDLSLTGQVTIRVPHTSDFQAIDVRNYVGDAKWIEAARTNAPEENPDYDYLSFSFTGLSGSSNFFNWEANTEKLVFSFKNQFGCVSGVSLMSADDPFNVIDNSAGTRPGNQFTNIGWGTVESNNYRANYGEPVSCPYIIN